MCEVPRVYERDFSGTHVRVHAYAPRHAAWSLRSPCLANKQPSFMVRHIQSKQEQLLGWLVGPFSARTTLFCFLRRSPPS